MTNKKAHKNYVLLIGNVGRKPRFVKFDDGTEVANFSLATNTDGTYTNAETGKTRSYSDWHMIATRNPEHIEIIRSLNPGDEVELAGILKSRSYTAQGESKKRYITEVVIEKGIEVLHRKTQKDEPVTNGADTAKATATT